VDVDSGLDLDSENDGEDTRVPAEEISGEESDASEDSDEYHWIEESVEPTPKRDIRTGSIEFNDDTQLFKGKSANGPNENSFDKSQTKTPGDFFSLFWTNALLSTFVEVINGYGSRAREKPEGTRKSSKDDKYYRGNCIVCKESTSVKCINCDKFTCIEAKSIKNLSCFMKLHGLESPNAV